MERNIEIKNNLEIENEKIQNKFLNNLLGKTINNAIDFGIRMALPDFIEEQIINLKDNLLNNGLKEGINKSIEEGINLGKSAIGIFTGKFENISQVQSVIKNGGIIDNISNVLDKTINILRQKGKIDFNTSMRIKQGKNIILNNVERNIEKTYLSQLKSAELTEKYIKNWNKAYQNQDFKGMEREYYKIKETLKDLMPIEKTIKEARKIENIFLLIKNKGIDFNLSENEKELLDKLN